MSGNMSRRGFVGGLALVAIGPKLAHSQIETPLTRRNLTGLWRGTYQEAGYIIGGEIIFEPNSTYRHTQVLGSLMTWAAGTYSIAENWVHFEIENFGPEEYQGTKQYRPMSETWMVDSFDGQSIDARIGDATEVHYERAG